MIHFQVSRIQSETLTLHTGLELIDQGKETEIYPAGESANGLKQRGVLMGFPLQETSSCWVGNELHRKVGSRENDVRLLSIFFFCGNGESNPMQM